MALLSLGWEALPLSPLAPLCSSAPTLLGVFYGPPNVLGLGQVLAPTQVLSLGPFSEPPLVGASLQPTPELIPVPGLGKGHHDPAQGLGCKAWALGDEPTLGALLRSRDVGSPCDPLLPSPSPHVRPGSILSSG